MNMADTLDTRRGDDLIDLNGSAVMVVFDSRPNDLKWKPPISAKIAEAIERGV